MKVVYQSINQTINQSLFLPVVGLWSLLWWLSWLWWCSCLGIMRQYHFNEIRMIIDDGIIILIIMIKVMFMPDDLIIMVKMMFSPDDCVSGSLRWTLWVDLAEALWRSGMFLMSVRKLNVTLDNCSHWIEWKQLKTVLFAQCRVQIQ